MRGRIARRTDQRGVEYFDGAIAGMGTASGARIVVGFWPGSPLGSFADVMFETAAGHRILLAPNQECADYVRQTYRFDEVWVVPVVYVREALSWQVSAGPLTLIFTTGKRGPLGWLLQAVPRSIARSRWWATLIDPVARVVMKGVRTRGTAGSNRSEWYSALDAHPIKSLSAYWKGDDLGELRPVDPPVTFGFGSTPVRPTLVRIRTTIRR